MTYVTATDFSIIYQELLYNLVHYPEYTISPHGEKVYEIQNCGFVLKDPMSCFFLNNTRSSKFRYILAEFVWYITGHREIDFISKFSKFWKHLVDEDDKVNSNYGNLVFWVCDYTHTQFSYAKKCLAEDKDSRQAFIHFNRPIHQYDGNKDQVCTMYGIYAIRDNKLNFTIHMRSNDVVLGLPTDLPFFCFLQIMMLHELKEFYPDLELGTYTHIANSMHLYDRNLAVVTDMLKNRFIATHAFFDDYKDELFENFGQLLKTMSHIYSDFTRNTDYQDHTPMSDFEMFVRWMLCDKNSDKKYIDRLFD